MKLFRHAVALAAAAAPLLFASPAFAKDADPAMWVVRDADTTIYLLGTFHALGKDTEWFNDEVKTAFDSADEVVIETIVPENPAEMQPIILKHALDTSGAKLSERLSPKGRKLLEEKLAAMGAPANAFDSFKPFFASIALVAASAPKLGIDPANGADKQIEKAAKADKKTLTALETPEFQIAMFEGLSDREQLDMLERTLADFDEMPALLTKMLDHWSTGDEEGFRKLLDDMNDRSPKAHKIIFSDRNATWADWVNKRLDRPGTVFMAVGTGHLAGSDSVQAYLAKRGIESKRVTQ